MKMPRKIETFTDRYPLIGPTMWILSVQYFIIQIIVARAWASPYSILNNTISDLGNTSCGIYAGRDVCSPLHIMMNVSFMILGLFMIGGSLLIYQEFKESKLALVGFTFMLLAGVGTLLVGVFPENTISTLHLTGAFLPFFIGNVGIVILGMALKLPTSLRVYTLATGIISLIALGFFVTHSYLGIGIGGMERITAYPQTLWLIVFGVYISKNHFMRSKPSQ
ncbi:MAG TPA: DUF998 domain-containing protein [Candidatus Saccharimonadales bacterium]|nr:DUF998 domain-containing protein [Candidatus Saccharimonadales bacterium]